MLITESSINPSSLKQFLKRILSTFRIYISKNQKYDALLEKILKKELKSSSNCVDVGSHKGEILDLFLKYAPSGKHIGFEPLPHLFSALQEKYSSRVTLKDCGLSNVCEQKEFTHVKNAEAFSGFKQRDYQNRDVSLNKITVTARTLDDVISEETITPIDFIKIDVEGAELEVLEGAKDVILSHKPLVVFEHGKGAAEFYKTTPEEIFNFFKTCEMKVFTLTSFLNGKTPLSIADFTSHFASGDEYYFVAGK